jgi:hypothetical protein
MQGEIWPLAGILSLFGQTVHGIHPGFMLLNLSAVLLIFPLGKKLISDFAARLTKSLHPGDPN